MFFPLHGSLFFTRGCTGEGNSVISGASAPDCDPLAKGKEAALASGTSAGLSTASSGGGGGNSLSRIGGVVSRWCSPFRASVVFTSGNGVMVGRPLTDPRLLGGSR